MSTHNIPFSNKIENNPRLTQICSYRIFFQGTPEGFRNSRGKRVISIGTTEVQLYVFCKKNMEGKQRVTLIQITRLYACESCTVCQCHAKKPLSNKQSEETFSYTFVFFAFFHCEKYSRPSVARILMARLQQLFRTRF